MKNFIYAIFCSLVLSVFIFGQDSRGFIQPLERAGKPRPLPPSCCRPFRSDGAVEKITLPVIGSIIGGGSSVTLAPENLTKYRISLEKYREATEKSRRSGTITKEDYDVMIAAYRLRMAEYKVKVFKIELDRLERVQ